jgi:uncharacterized radical SAM protein YgiQ
MSFLPITMEELNNNGISAPDFIMVSGDAYIDHPSFGVSIISRVLENNGFSVAIISQPDWNNTSDFMTFGKPKLGFLVTAGNIDSMVNHYTVSNNTRKKDMYTPGGVMGKRPNRATIVYCNKIREVYKDSPIIIGGIEASLRRLAHYDYWDNKIRRSILLDSSADLLVYGMAENQIVEIADCLKSGIAISDITFIKGTVYKTKDISYLEKHEVLPTYKNIISSKKEYAKSFLVQHNNTDFATSKILVENYESLFVVQNTPAPPITASELDKIYALPFMKNYHPIYEKDGGVPAIEEVKFSIISNRGCFGGCNFCALTYHQGRIVQARSHESILQEAESMTKEPSFKGYIHDVGGPTANFRFSSCDKQLVHGSCKHKQCLFPKPCEKLKIDHSDYLTLLTKLRQIPKIKKVFVRSGIRYDYLIHDKDNAVFFKELCEHHVSGQLKVAPEHTSSRVLEKMGKPNFDVYEKFVKKYETTNKALDKKQYLVPYLMSSHPGSDLDAAVELAEYLRDIGHRPEQVQDFHPTPGTLSTCMYYTELDPRTMEKVYVPKSKHEKAMQRALIQYTLPQNYSLVKEALLKCGREDLIGFERKCLIKPFVNNYNQFNNEQATKNTTHSRKKTIRNVHSKKTR